MTSLTADELVMRVQEPDHATARWTSRPVAATISQQAGHVIHDDIHARRGDFCETGGALVGEITDRGIHITDATTFEDPTTERSRSSLSWSLQELASTPGTIGMWHTHGMGHNHTWPSEPDIDAGVRILTSRRATEIVMVILAARDTRNLYLGRLDASCWLFARTPDGDTFEATNLRGL